MSIEQSVEQLSEYQAIARILHNLFCHYPDAELIHSMVENDVAATWPTFANRSDNQQGRDALTTYLNHWNEAEQLLDLKVDYGQLFFGPGEPKAIPQGSAYLGEDQVHFDASTIALIDFYKQYGVNFDLTMPQPVDHIGLFFSVLDSSFATLQEAATNPDSDTDAQQLTQFIQVLLQQHMLPWAGRCLELAKINAETDFYVGISLLANDYLAELAEAFKILPMPRKLFR
ncbi:MULTISPECIES: molecular chaperone [Shewanella]|jgi:TorA maturation chaperone TorD|uniref:Molecular chaperone TorD family protein n=1 Tax=Shewanella electrodiphila TaxID=934143 RepID=A0ABT0KTC4_9GAMM|nr:molecular chaperone TorD family protein [Shewanella electrodiphila]MCL1047077.1 molecular chaperone TorD family protein [Shewanella electrodiphila]